MWISGYLETLIFGVFFTSAFAVKPYVTFKRENELIELLNRGMDPCNDFFEFACGNYKRKYPIPDYKGKYEMLDRLNEDNFKLLDRLLVENIGQLLQNCVVTAEDKAKVFYSSCKNTAEIDNQGIAPLLRLLDSLGGMPALKQNWINPYSNWYDIIAEVHKIMYKNPVFEEFIYDRDKQNLVDRIMPTFQPPKDILGSSEEEQDRLKLILELLGLDEAAVNKTHAEYYGFYSWILTLGYSSQHTIKTAQISEFEQLVPLFNWTDFLYKVYGIQFSSTDYISVWDVEYFSLLPSVVIYFEGLEKAANFVLLNLINYLLPTLDSRFVNISGTLHQTKEGHPSKPPRWRKCIDIVTEVMNIPTAAMFVRETYDPESRRNIQQMLNELKSVSKEYLQNSNWPSLTTKAKALDKLDAFDLDFGWEDLIRSTSMIDAQYANIKVRPSNFFDSYINMKRLAVQQIGNIYVTQSRDQRWNIRLVEAEAFNNLMKNKMSMNPGILRSPFYNARFTSFLKYGGLGFTLAHEIFHGFDTAGYQFNAEGKYENWWTQNDYDVFRNRAQCFKTQYDNFELNGQSLSQRGGDSENIADASGIQFAYMAFDKFLKANPTLENETIPGLELTSRQLFFVSTAQCFCTTLRPEATQFYIENDGHAAGPYRVNGYTQNSEDFARVFNCRPGSPMNPRTKCSIFKRNNCYR